MKTNQKHALVPDINYADLELIPDKERSETINQVQAVSICWPEVCWNKLTSMKIYVHYLQQGKFDYCVLQVSLLDRDEVINVV